jgi:hypothetical protein
MLIPLANLRQQLQAIYIGQAKIQHHDIRGFGPDCRQRLLPTGHVINHETLPAQGILQPCSEGGVIFYQ